MRPDHTAWPKTADGLPSEPAAATEPAVSWLARAPVVLGLIGLYLIIHFTLRLFLSPTLGLDDAEQILFAQQWDFGYRFRQPPLFTWLLMPVIELVGPGLLAINILRYGLLALTFVPFYLTARLCFRDARMAGLAVFSFALIYVFAYYAHHDLTHTTALGALIAIALYAFVRLALKPDFGAYLLLGLVFGLGMLAKWNFIMLAIGLPLTCLALPAWRHLVLTWKLLLAIIVMALATTPTALWMLEHGQSVQGVSNTILGSGDVIPSLPMMLKGAGALGNSILLFPLPFLPIFLLMFQKSFRAGLAIPEDPRHRTPPPSFFGWLTLIVLALHGLLIPIFGAIEFTERWLHPALMALPLFLFGVLERGRPAGPKIASYLAIVAILVAVSLGARLYRYERGADDCGRCREFAPFADLASDLRAKGFSTGTIIAYGMHIGGNFKMLFAESRVIDPAFPMALWPASTTDGDCLLVWRSDIAHADVHRDRLNMFARRELGLPKTAPSDEGRLEAPVIGSSDRRYALGFELYKETVGGCR